MEASHKTRGTITKAEICDLYEFSGETLRKILNVHLYEELKPLGYKKRCKLVPNVVYRKFQEFWGEPLNA
ncbi:hypothetical protein [Brumimicrobium aurantiacum]|uniref:DNA-binding protein n=1 Tax=Brumimicrobium aurantiacum TaxID=1737063 RepID=A0A3E1EZ67_9FLAO|nr:hypothetical protein [Brumimicrobium aurantiacum]RFC54860.1 hypothetical protein DXU93_03300 [Brumimicrobium aurantiacum]